MKVELIIIFFILTIYFKNNNIFTSILDKLTFVKDVFSNNFLIPGLIILILIVSFSGSVSNIFKKTNKVSGDDILDEFQFVSDVRNVTSSGKIKQKEIYDKFKEKVSDKQNNLCNFCGKRIGILSEFDVVFIVPLSRGGNNNLSNSQALCNSCCESKNSIDKFLQ
jgi:hypothetical protein